MDKEKKNAFVDLLGKVLIDSNFSGVDVGTLKAKMMKFMDNEASINVMETEVAQSKQIIAQQKQTIAQNETSLKNGADTILERDEEIRTLSVGLRKLEGEKNALQKTTSELETVKNDLRAKNKKLEKDTKSLEDEINAAKVENGDLKGKIVVLEAKSKNTGVDRLNKRIKELEQQKRKDVNELQSAYMHPQMNTSTFSSFFF